MSLGSYITYKCLISIKHIFHKEEIQHEEKIPIIIQKVPDPSMASEKTLPLILYLPTIRNSGKFKTHCIDIVSGFALSKDFHCSNCLFAIIFYF